MAIIEPHKRVVKASQKHLQEFEKSKQRPSENIEAWLFGYTGNLMGKGKDTQRNGVIALTNERICFMSKGVFTETFEGIDLKKISSLEQRSTLGKKGLIFHTSNTEIDFKTLETKERYNEFYEAVQNRMAFPQPVKTVTDEKDHLKRLEQLKQMAESGLITEKEYEAKRIEILNSL